MSSTGRSIGAGERKLNYYKVILVESLEPGCRCALKTLADTDPLIFFGVGSGRRHAFGLGEHQYKSPFPLVFTSTFWFTMPFVILSSLPENCPSGLPLVDNRSGYREARSLL